MPSGEPWDDHPGWSNASGGGGSSAGTSQFDLDRKAA